MTKFKTVTILLIGALAVAAVFGVFAYRAANAATTGSNKVSTTLNVPALRGWDLPGKGRGTASEDLAKALGISVDELNTAYEESYSAALDQAVAAGLITQAQADQLRDSGRVFPFDDRWNGWLGQNDIDFQAILAEKLGITVEKLQEAHTQAFEARIDQAVADGNLTQEEADLMKGQRALFSSESFRSSMQSAFEAAVQQAVDAGIITQAQADLIIKNRADMPGGMGFPGFGGNRRGGMGGRGGRGRHGGWGDGVPGVPDQTNPDTAPDSGL